MKIKVKEAGKGKFEIIGLMKIPEQEADEDFDGKEFIREIKVIYRRLDLRDIVIILLVALMVLIYIVHLNDITACNNYYRELIEQIKNPLYSITQFK